MARGNSAGSKIYYLIGVFLIVLLIAQVLRPTAEAFFAPKTGGSPCTNDNDCKSAFCWGSVNGSQGNCKTYEGFEDKEAKKEGFSRDGQGLRAHGDTCNRDDQCSSNKCNENGRCAFFY